MDRPHWTERWTDSQWGHLTVEDRRSLEEDLRTRVTFDTNNYTQTLTARLYHLSYRQHDYEMTEGHAAIKQYMVDTLVRHYMESQLMPLTDDDAISPTWDNVITTTLTTTNPPRHVTTTTTTNPPIHYDGDRGYFRVVEEEYNIAAAGLSNFHTEEQPVETETETAPLTFEMQLNTQDNELREISDRYPREIFRTNFQAPLHVAIQETRNMLRDNIRYRRRIEAACTAYDALPPKLRTSLFDMFSGEFRGNVLARIAESPENRNFEDIHPFNETEILINQYRQNRQRFIENRNEFGPIQARASQEIAMVRQKPRQHMTIDTTQIIEVLSSWDNIWGVAVTKSALNDYLKVRVGLCNIAMSESAGDNTRYEDPFDINLAPFYFTLKLNSNGHFTCPSGSRNTRGLSREEEGQTQYDIHPHQLSDQPCFGSFAQSFADMANAGDVISLISGIIAFYSQYNSEDSAGVAARYWHPHYLAAPRDITQYIEVLHAGMTGLGPRHVIDDDKLDYALEDYMKYHADAQANENPPQMLTTQTCSHCEDAPVGDNDEFWVTNGGDRICEGCWMDHYCTECERHVEECVCNDDEY